MKKTNENNKKQKNNNKISGTKNCGKNSTKNCK